MAVTAAVVAVAACCAAVAALQQATSSSSSSKKQQSAQQKTRTIAIAFAGNSMLYYNDCPRLVEQMLRERSTTKAIRSIHQDSCLRGGATLPSLWRQGNGMAQKFATPPAAVVVEKPQRRIIEEEEDGGGSSSSIVVGVGDDSDDSTTATKDDGDDGGERRQRKKEQHDSTTNQHCYYDVGAETVEQLLRSRRCGWDFVVLNDYTQGPAREASRRQTERALREHYAPCLLKNSSSNNDVSTTTVILIQTPAYRVPGIKDSADLGGFAAMTDRLAHGLRSYQAALRSAGIVHCRVAPVGEAYRYLHDTNRPLWHKLYHRDDFHPSPHGTWLQACVLFCTMRLSCFPPLDDEDGREEEAAAAILPPAYRPEWWERSRVMQPADEPPLPRPTAAEARELRRVACLVCCGAQRQQQQQPEEEEEGEEEEEPERWVVPQQSLAS